MPKVKSAVLEAAELIADTWPADDLAARLRREDRERVRMERALVDWQQCRLGRVRDETFAVKLARLVRIAERIERRRAKK